MPVVSPLRWNESSTHFFFVSFFFLISISFLIGCKRTAAVYHIFEVFLPTKKNRNANNDDLKAKILMINYSSRYVV